MSATERVSASKNEHGEYARTGTRSNHYTSRKGLSANIDIENVDSKIKRELAGYGKGKTRFAFIDDNGNPDTKAIFESGGIIFNPNKDGVFTMVDEAWLEHEQKLADELEDYIDTVVDYCTTDQTAMAIFDMNKADFDSTFGSGTPNPANYGLSTELAGVDCRPSYMKSLLPNSQLFAGSASKLRRLIEYFRPIIQSKRETKSGGDKGKSEDNVKPGGDGAVEEEATN